MSMRNRGLSWDGEGARRSSRLLAVFALAGVNLIGAIVPAAATDLDPQGAGWEDASSLQSYDPSTYLGSMIHVGYKVGVDAYWSQGYTGTGVDVALIDTGVAPVAGLNATGKVLNGPDLSFESQSTAFRYLDTNGHGTHLAGIIAGRDNAAPTIPSILDSGNLFLGIAPGARIVNVKVGTYDGAVDVSQVIAAIDWVTQNRNKNGLNIRVLNLAYGTDSTQSAVLDPLSHAVERAWKAGIVVVVASGNDGNASPVRMPATNPFVITVGAIDGMRLNGKSAQPIPTWSNCGTTRTVDVVAPGASIVGLRNPGSKADLDYPTARVAGRYFLGSGTSQASAVVSGAAALVLSHRPALTPDQVKSVLKQSAAPMRKVSQACQGAGVVDLYGAWWATPGAAQTFAASTGFGTLEASRGTEHLTNNGVMLTGEKDIFGRPFYSPIWSVLASTGTSWWEGTWNGSVWTGSSWSGSSWSGSSWSGSSWSGSSWSGSSWSNMTWNGSSWSGSSWSGSSWSGSSWSGSSWSGQRWE